MITRIKNLLLTETSKDTGVVFVGTLVNVFLGGLFFIISPRILGPSAYGLFATVFATSTMVVRLSSLGMDTGILRFAHINSQKANQFLTIAFKWYLVIGLVVATIGFFISPALAIILNQPQITNLLRLAFASTILFQLTNLFTAGLQARQEFAKASIALIANNAARLIFLLAGSYFFTLNLYSLSIIFFAATIVSTLLGKLFLPFNLQKIDKSAQQDFFKFNMWVWISMSIASIPFDNYFLIKMAGAFQTGLYAAPFKLISYAYQLGGNFTSVLASRFATFNTDSKAKEFSAKAAILPLIFSSAFIIPISFPSFVISLFFGRTYLQAAQILQILSLGAIFFFVSTIPSSIIFYYFGKSNVSFTITVFRFTLMVGLLIILIPTQKAVGAAWAFTLSEIFSFVMMTSYVFLKFKNRK